MLKSFVATILALVYLAFGALQYQTFRTAPKPVPQGMVSGETTDLPAHHNRYMTQLQDLSRAPANEPAQRAMGFDKPIAADRKGGVVSQSSTNPRPFGNSRSLNSEEFSKLLLQLAAALSLLPQAAVSTDLFERQIERMQDSFSSSLDHYLPLNGGALTGLGVFANGFLSQASSTVAGDLTVTGTLTGGSISVASPLSTASGGTGTTTWQSGSIPFYNGTNLAEDSNFVWDSTNDRLGIGTSVPQSFVHITPPGTTTNSLADGVLLRVAGTVDGSRGIVLSPQMTGYNTSPGGVSLSTDIWPAVNLSTAFGTILTSNIAGNNGNANITALHSGYMRLSTASNYSGVISSAETLYLEVPTTNGSVPATMYGLRVQNQGKSGGTTSYGLFIASQSGASNSYAGVFQGGNVGIGITTPTAQLHVAGNLSAASWTTTGRQIATNSSTLTDTSSSPGTTITTRAANSFAIPSFAFSTGTSTITNAATIYINGAPKGDNASSTIITNSYSLLIPGVSIASGNVTTNGYGLSVSAPTGATNNYAAVFPAGNVGIGTTSPWSKLSVTGAGSGTGYTFIVANSSNAVLFNVQDNGSVGIGTTSPWRKFSVNGTVAFSGLTNDTADQKALCLTAAGELVANTGSSCITSSQRFKHNIAPLDSTSGLAELLKWSPVSFVYNEDVGISGAQVGFIAEEMQQIDPRLVAVDASSAPYTVRYEQLTAVIAKAVQELAAISGVFRANLIAFLADATNGIGALFAGEIHARSQLCVGATCVTAEQFEAMITAAGQGSTSPQPSSCGSGLPVDSISTEPPLSDPVAVATTSPSADIGSSITTVSEPPPQSADQLGTSDTEQQTATSTEFGPNPTSP